MSRSDRQRTEGSESGPPLSPLPSAAVPPPVAVPRLLALMLVLYLIAGFVHGSLVPSGQTGYQNAPDEAAHVNYVRILATGRLPTQHDGSGKATISTYEWHQPPLYYAIEAIGLGEGIRVMRLISVLLGVCCIFAIYRLCLVLLPEDPAVALLAAAIAALTPGHIAVTSTVNNDVLLELWFSLTFLVLMTAMRSGYSVRRAGWLGVCVGAALLTKSTALLLLPIVGVGVVLMTRRGERITDLLRSAVWTGVVTLAISGWWYARNGIIYHEWLPMRAFEQSFRGTAQAADVVSGKIPIPLPLAGWSGYWLLVSRWSFQSYWAVFGTPHTVRYGVPVFLPDAIYELLALFVIAVLCGMVIVHVRRNTLFSELQNRFLRLLLVAIGLVCASFVAFLTHYFQTQGRYLYPVMAGNCTVMALGWRALFAERYRNIASAGIVIVIGLAAVIFLISVQAAANPQAPILSQEQAQYG